MEEQTNTKQVFVASSKTCGPCFALKARLEKENIPVEIKYFEDNHEFFFNDLSIRTVPQLVIIENSDITKIQGQDDIVSVLKEMNL